MDVKLPNGVVVKNIPEGTTKDQLVGKLAAGGYDINSLMQAPSQSLSGDIATAVSNIPSSALNLAGDLASAVMSPVQTGKSILDLLAGTAREGARKVLPESVFSFLGSIDNKAAAEHASKVATAVGSHLKKRYGEDLRKTLTTDPVGVGADVAGLLSGGAGLVGKGAASIASLGGKSAQLTKLAEASRKTSSAIAAVDPANLMLKVPAKAAGAIAAQGLGLSTGAGAQAIKEAYKAGAAPSITPSREFLSNISGKREQTAVVAQAEEAFRKMRDADYQNYLANTNQMRGDTTVLSAVDIANSINSSKDIFRDKQTGYVRDKSARDIWRTISDEYRTWASNPNIKGVSKDFDQFKQAIGSLYESNPQGKSAAVLKQVYESIGDTIRAQNPKYHSAMEKSASAINELKSIRKELSLGDKQKTASALKKLQSVMRNNVNTGWGSRVKMADELQKYAAPGVNLRASLAGQALSSTEPRGLARVPTGLGAGAGASLLGANPALAIAAGLGGMAASSPRLVGYGAYGAGLASPAIDAISQMRLPAVQAARENAMAEREAARRRYFGDAGK